ncbi:MAG: PHP domain-containing protein [Corallococcus sp.]|nr:PHP domain-containing protein [Bacillota bacterium]MCM1533588.1 PHP domain-containing protein [Corallococcus sp.]
MKCDLHIHSDCSDGIFPPEKLVEMAKDRGMDCISVTDHDTFDGVLRAKKRAEELHMKYVVGAEISSVGICEAHILAYNVDLNASGFAEDMSRIADMRNQRNIAMVQKLKEYGIEIDLDRLRGEGTVGRAVIAREMVNSGVCKDVPEAFDKYLGTGKCCFVQTRRLTPEEAVRFILMYGGIPVLAHPKQLRLKRDEFVAFLESLVKVGLGGIEAQYFTHTKSERNYYCKLAKKYKLIATGGSDFHDYTHGVELGTASFSPNGYTRKILGI